MASSRRLGALGAALVAWTVVHGCGGDDVSQLGGDAGGLGADASTDATAEGYGDDDVAVLGEASADAADATAEAGPDASGDAAAADGAADSGGCATDTDCSPQGSICGLTTPGVCSPCASDADCKNDPYYTGMGWDLCDVTTHVCEQGLCAVADGQPCPQNGADVCCGGECSTGTCCSDAQCSGSTPACRNHTCVACDAVASGTYYVDPNNGSDALDGSGKSGGHPAPGCAFRTLTHALSVIGTPAAPTTIVVLGPSQLSAGETFPFVVPPNTRITNQGALVTVKVPATVAASDGGTQPGVGFVVDASGVTLDSLTIDGQSNGSAHGVLVGTGGVLTASLLDVHGFTGGAAMRVEGSGSATLSCGTFLTDSARGLHVTDQATVAASCTPATLLFSRNTGEGIRVDTQGAISIAGVPGTGGGGSVQASGNGVGVSVSATPAGSLPPASSIDGLVAWANATGALINGGSRVTIRRSQFLGGTIGVDVEPDPNATASQMLTGGIDLGTAAGDAGAGVGGNTFQQPGAPDAGANPHNTGVGVCFSIPPTAMQTLQAAGDSWSDTTGTTSLDCALSSGTLSKNLTACTGGGDLGGLGLATGNTLNVTSCN